MIETLTKEKATLKAKYKHKVIIKTETIRAEISEELHAMTAQYERTKDLLEQRTAELEILYQRVEELEMMQSNNSDEIAKIHTHYKLLISQLKSELEATNKKWGEKIVEMSRIQQIEIIRIEKAYLEKIEWYKSNIKVIN